MEAKQETIDNAAVLEVVVEETSVSTETTNAEPIKAESTDLETPKELSNEIPEETIEIDEEIKETDLNFEDPKTKADFGKWGY